MSFEFTVHGQPPSWNHSYDIRRSGYRPVVVKTEELVAYQDHVERTCARAKPDGWHPALDYVPRIGQGLIVIEYRFYLKNDIDCDNMMKSINDAVALGLGWRPSVSRNGRVLRRPLVDDKCFLPRAMTKQTGCKDPHVDITVIG